MKVLILAIAKIYLIKTALLFKQKQEQGLNVGSKAEFDCDMHINVVW